MANKVFKAAAFGALNPGSYAMFAEHLARQAREKGIGVELMAAGPYPNAGGVSAPGRPLRADALRDDAKKQQLFEAVADDARAINALDCDVLCIPCMSMIGFHDGVERALGRKIFRLADAITRRYEGADKVGVLHMRPAKNRIEEIFGPRAVTPDEAQAERLLKAEEEAKRLKDAAPVEAVMRDIAESWRDAGLRRILFARADAPLAEKGVRVAGVEILSTFAVLAEAVVESLKNNEGSSFLSIRTKALIERKGDPSQERAQDDNPIL